MAEVRLYRNTRYNGVNRPHSLSIVKDYGTVVKTVNIGNIIQGEGLSYIDVALSSAEATAVDFIIVKGNDGIEVGYTPSLSHETRGGGTVRFYLDVAALSTILPTIDVISGSAERMHVSKTIDDQEYFSLIEPFQPSQELTILDIPLDNRITPGCYNILEVIAIPPQIVKVEEGFVQVTNETEGGANNIKFNNTFAQIVDGILTWTNPEYNIVKNQIAGSSQVRQVLDAVNNQLYSTSVVSSVGDTNYRKLFPTQLTLQGLGSRPGNSFSVGSRWFLESDIPSVIPGWDNKQLCATSSIINDLRGVGADNNITGYWAVPTFYISGLNHTQYNCNADGKTDNVGGISGITASKFDSFVGLTPFGSMAGYEPMNNKAIYGQATTITVFNPVSGDNRVKQIHQIHNNNALPGDLTINCDFSISADPRKDGCPIFAWKYNNGIEINGFPETISGGNWRQIPISGEGVQGSYWQQRNLDLQRKGSERSLIGGLVKAGAHAGAGAIAGSIVPGVGTGVGAIVGGVTSVVGDVTGYILQDKSIKEQEQTLNMQGQVAEAELVLSSSNYIRDCGYNAFYAYTASYAPTDMESFDMFLTKFGYNVGNKWFTKDDFYTRDHFNFIKANDVHISSGRWSDYMVNKAIEELKRGVRIWHNIPDEDDYYNND